jgi:hypothetical protein
MIVMSDDGFFSRFRHMEEQLSPVCRETPSSSDSGASTLGNRQALACVPERLSTAQALTHRLGRFAMAENGN